MRPERGWARWTGVMDPVYLGRQDVNQNHLPPTGGGDWVGGEERGRRYHPEARRLAIAPDSGVRVSRSIRTIWSAATPAHPDCRGGNDARDDRARRTAT